MQIPNEVREKTDPRFGVCTVISEQRLDSYKLRCEHGLVQGVSRTDQLVSLIFQIIVSPEALVM